MSRARDNANNWAADITGVTAGTGITGGGTSGAVTVTNEMATTIDAKGDLLVGSGADAYVRVPVGTNNQVLTADSATTSGVKWATADALPSQTGNSGKYLTTNGTTASWGTVNQPLSFTERKPANGYRIYGMAHSGSLYVAVGDTGYLYTSSDGYTWTSRTSGFGTDSIYDVAYGNGLFVAVGANGKITTSTDGTTWTARTSNVGTNQINAVEYANSIWVAVADGGGTTNTGGIIYSTDGITWTRKSQSLTVGTSYKDVCWNGTNWLVVANYSTNNYIYASTPSGTWTAGASGASSANWCGSDGTRSFIQRGDVMTFTSSSTFSSWSAISSIGLLQGSNYPYYIYDNKIYMSNSAIFSSMSSTPNQGPSGAWYGANYVPILNPLAEGYISSPNIVSDIGKVFVNSSGIIICGGNGRILTSF